jgi:hypothetical protein
MKTVIVQPNQSFADIAIQETGSAGAAMQLCYDNGVSITDVPETGAAISITDAAMVLGDAAVLRYIQGNGIGIGTLGVPPGDLPLLNTDGEVLFDTDGEVLFDTPNP